MFLATLPVLACIVYSRRLLHAQQRKLRPRPDYSLIAATQRDTAAPLTAVIAEAERMAEQEFRAEVPGCPRE